MVVGILFLSLLLYVKINYCVLSILPEISNNFTEQLKNHIYVLSNQVENKSDVYPTCNSLSGFFCSFLHPSISLNNPDVTAEDELGYIESNEQFLALYTDSLSWLLDQPQFNKHISGDKIYTNKTGDGNAATHEENIEKQRSQPHSHNHISLNSFIYHVIHDHLFSGIRSFFKGLKSTDSEDYYLDNNQAEENILNLFRLKMQDSSVNKLNFSSHINIRDAVYEQQSGDLKEKANSAETLYNINFTANFLSRIDYLPHLYGNPHEITFNGKFPIVKGVVYIPMGKSSINFPYSVILNNIRFSSENNQAKFTIMGFGSLKLADKNITRNIWTVQHTFNTTNKISLLELTKLGQFQPIDFVEIEAESKDIILMNIQFSKVNTKNTFENTQTSCGVLITAESSDLSNGSISAINQLVTKNKDYPVELSQIKQFDLNYHDTILKTMQIYFENNQNRNFFTLDTSSTKAYVSADGVLISPDFRHFARTLHFVLLTEMPLTSFVYSFSQLKKLQLVPSFRITGMTETSAKLIINSLVVPSALNTTLNYADVSDLQQKLNKLYLTGGNNILQKLESYIEKITSSNSSIQSSFQYVVNNIDEILSLE